MTEKVLKPTPQFELPPDLINGIIEKLLQALIERILAYFQAPSLPPAVINPPPIIVAPPPNVDPGPPTSPPLVYEQWLQAGIHVIYHNWFKGNEAEGVPAGNSTAVETEKVRQGIMGCPPGARIHVSADPMPRNCVEYPFPKVHVIRKNEENGVEEEVVLTKENPQPESFCIIQGGATDSSVYIRSSGHFFILVFDEPAVRSSYRIWLEASNGARSNEFGCPWAIRGNGANLTVKSASAEPFVYEEPQELQERTMR